MQKPPPFSKIVADYDLGAIISGADFVLDSTGDLVLTDDGRDLKIGDTKCNAMHRLIRYWQYNEPTLSTLYLLADELSARDITLQNGLDIYAAAYKVGSTDVQPWHDLNDGVAAASVGRDACAGALIVIVNNLLQAYRSELSVPQLTYNMTCPVQATYSLGAIVWAASNNFRHNDEWARAYAKTQSFTPQQRESIRVLADVLDIDVARYWTLRDNVCPQVLRLISGGSFEFLGASLFDFAKALSALV